MLPEVADLHGVEQSRYHHLDVYGHTLEVLARQLELESRLEELFGPLAPRLEAVLAEPLADELTRGQALRLAALLHDVGKPGHARRARQRPRDLHRPRRARESAWWPASAAGCAPASG